MIRSFLTLMAVASVAFAQARRPAVRPKPKPPATAPAPAAEATAWPIESLSVEGAKRFPEARILQVAGLKVGQKAGKEEFEAARSRLQQSGCFDAVGFRFDPVPGKTAIQAVIQVSEIQQTFPWRVEDLPLTQEEAARIFAAADPLFDGKVTASELVFRRLTAALERGLEAKKFAEPILYRLQAADPSNDLVVVFRPRTQPPTIGVVNFSGSKVWDEGALRLQFNNIAIGAPYAEARFREYLDTTIRPMFEARGRLRVTFPKVSAEPMPGSKGVAVNVVIEDGPEYKLSNVQVTGVPFPPGEIEKLGAFGEGETANFGKIGQGVTKIIDALKAAGYLKPQYKLQRKVNDAEKSVEVFFTCEPGGQYTMGKLTIKGLDIIAEPVVRKMWAIQAGKPFNNTYPQFFLDRIRTDNVFDDLGKTGYEVVLDDQALVADVVLTFSGEAVRPAEGRRRRP